MSATFEIEINGRRRTVTVEPAGADGRFRVTFDGCTRVVDARFVGADRLSLVFPERSGEAVTLLVAPDGASGLHVHLPGPAVRVVIDGARARGAGRAPRHGDGEQRIVTPMAGRVVRVLAAPGDAVAERQPLVVVEAMKMENEFVAPRAGRVKEITVREGAAVEAGRVLAVLE
jgi:acetyl-CoA/propionyl-CoA carboxylase biotin carboxyl carrier protein